MIRFSRASFNGLLILVTLFGAKKAIAESTGSVNPTPLAVPTNVRALVVPRQDFTTGVNYLTLTITWQHTGNSDRFVIQRRVNATNSTWENYGFTFTRTFTRSERFEDLYSYRYRVAAVYQGVQSPFSTEALPPPLAPQLGSPGVAVNYALRRLGVGIHWLDRSSNERGFYILRRQVTISNYGVIQNTSPWTQVGSVGPNISRFEDFAVSPSVTYQYQVVAFNEGGVSAVSTTISYRTQHSLRF